jgi:hypothetical protein
LDALKHININTISQINHLKAGINIEGYGHIMSFRRQMYINHEDIPKLPSSMLITQNDNQFRIFFTDDTLTCFLCKATGHTSNNCKKKPEKNPTIEPIINTNATYDLNNTYETQTALTEDVTHSSPSNSQLEGNHLPTNMDWSLEITSEAPLFSDNNDELPPMLTQKDIYKRPISDTSSLKPPDFPND